MGDCQLRSPLNSLLVDGIIRSLVDSLNAHLAVLLELSPLVIPVGDVLLLLVADAWVLPMTRNSSLYQHYGVQTAAHPGADEFPSKGCPYGQLLPFHYSRY